ncbi:HIT domain-containing protein [Rhodospirillum rubrum]|uniref:Histidine triad (HIT) protein n=1 Tax=Rhodospirillum rubrum (strain ATCC 11170 / ATH 1.1.1 / DSM 467 / LMG 4362 / NCIMB 8255 / S1) TaxID=269796 RepID=Q2RQ97_RHORT|nr:HIT family protein [Rhodospirillum rubrum]ABC23698.1 Histidine triad (HIT) protein [Rhodospirillum rubrum ATCC 11170]AEO49436.1 histidine triad (HIT) protein [Rhodospirillum rubrum F11]MBK5955374.1 HIT family protein [Rhodospirillum rubrum]QXG79653.1 HIT family protein [Rhodospirillum rubrum]HAQ01360.1 HIT family protein [Rhodospirillum rubrum]
MIDLDPRLAADTHPVTQWPLSQVRLMDDVRFPWLVLIPDRPGLVEIFDLPAEDQDKMWREVAHAAATLKTLSGAHKINIGALGNQVSQLHIHIIARRPDDGAWPGPVWGVGERQRYDQAELAEFLSGLRAQLIAPGQGIVEEGQTR